MVNFECKMLGLVRLILLLGLGIVSTVFMTSHPFSVCFSVYDSCTYIPLSTLSYSHL